MKSGLLFRLFATATLLTVVSSALLPLPAEARQRSRHTVGPKNGTLDRTVIRQPGSVEKASTYTSPKGKVSTKDTTRTFDKSTGTATANSTTNLANGKSSSRTLTSEKTETGRTTSAERTGFNGKTSTYDSTTTKTENGFTRSVDATGPNGGTVDKDIVVTKQDGTVTRTVTATATPPPKQP